MPVLCFRAAIYGGENFILDDQHAAGGAGQCTPVCSGGRCARVCDCTLVLLAEVLGAVLAGEGAEDSLAASRECAAFANEAIMCLLTARHGARSSSASRMYAVDAWSFGVVHAGVVDRYLV